MKYLLICFYLAFSFAISAQAVKQFKNGALTLYYEEFGSGPPLYILSGGPGEPPDHPYRQMIDSLQLYYTCVLLHQRASGKSRDIPVNNHTITIENYLDDIARLQQVRGDKKISLLGMSWGGLLAMNYAANHPKSVANLILVCSAPPSYKVWDVLFDNQYSRRSPAELDSMRMLHSIFSVRTDKDLDSLKRFEPGNKEVVAFKKFIHMHVRSMYYDRSNIDQHRIDTLFYNFNFQPIPIIDQEVLGTKWDITAKLKRLRIPALIIYGRQDDQGESTFYLQKESLKNSEMHVIEKCGHMILDEQPAAFFKILMRYVRLINQKRA